MKFTTALITNTKGEDAKSSDDFWQKAEVLLYCALIGYIWYEAPDEEMNMNTLVEYINAMEVHEEDENYKNAVDFIFEKLEKGDPKKGTKPQPQHFAVRQYKKYKLAAGEIRCIGRFNQTPNTAGSQPFAAQTDGRSPSRLPCLHEQGFFSPKTIPAQEKLYLFTVRSVKAKKRNANVIKKGSENAPRNLLYMEGVFRKPNRRPERRSNGGENPAKTNKSN